MLASRFVSDSRIQLPLLSPWREYGRREDRKGKEVRKGESVHWRFEGGNELPASTTLVMTRLPCLSLSSLRRSFPSVIPRQWSHLKPPGRRQNVSLDSLLNEMLHFPILFSFPKIEAHGKRSIFRLTTECNASVLSERIGGYFIELEILFHHSLTMFYSTRCKPPIFVDLSLTMNTQGSFH